MLKWRNVFGGGRSKRKAELRPPAPPTLPVDVLSPEFIADPAPAYAWLRENAPLAEVRGGGYLLTRSEDIFAAFTDARLGNAPSRFSMLAAKNRDRYVAADVAANIPPFLDKPRHIDMRRSLSAAFHDTFTQAQDWIDPLAERWAETLVDKGVVDIVSGFGRPFATEAMARFVGLDHDPAAIATATGALFKLFAPIMDRADFVEVNSGLASTRSYIGRAVIARKSDPGNDLISHLLAFQETHDGLPNDIEIGDNALLILADGIENIEAAIAQAICILVRTGRWQAFCNGEMDASATVLEVLRLETPAQLLPRVVREAHERHGVRLPEGTPLFLALGSANRDAARHADPDRFDILRDHSEVLTFGRGRHRCIGAALGQLLVSAGIRALAKHDVTFLSDPSNISYRVRIGHRWPKAVEVSVGPSRTG